MSQDINTGVFSEVLNGKADIDLRNIDTNKCDMVIEYQEPDPDNDYKWYRLYASGWVEQGGTQANNGANPTTVNLPITMADSKYTVQITPSGSLYLGLQIWYGVTSKNTTNFVFYLDGSSQDPQNGDWQVSGLADMTTHEILPNPTSNTARALVIQVLEEMYPVGSLYMGTQATCPMSVFFGTWELVSNGKALWTGDGTNANTTISAGLPNITGEISYDSTTSGVGLVARGQGSGSLYGKTNVAATINANQTSSTSRATLGLDASKSSSIYGKSSTVQPPAYVVNVWRRTA